MVWQIQSFSRWSLPTTLFTTERPEWYISMVSQVAEREASGIAGSGSIRRSHYIPLFLFLSRSLSLSHLLSSPMSSWLHIGLNWHKTKDGSEQHQASIIPRESSSFLKEGNPLHPILHPDFSQGHKCPPKAIHYTQGNEML